MSLSKRCEVCGGKVGPMDEKSIFGYCEKCGLVYALKDRIADQPSLMTPIGPGAGFGTEETKNTGEAWSTPRVATGEQGGTSRSRWRCPDCGTEIDSENESDLEFAKREHIREYHPNRAG